MSKTPNGRLIILTGPSCVGKTPLRKAFARLNPDLDANLKPLVLYNDRARRPGEVDHEDYHFCSHEEIESMRSRDNTVVMDVRGDLQALDIQELLKQLAEGDVLYEGNARVAEILIQHKNFQAIERPSLFISPLSQAEINDLRIENSVMAQQVVVTDVMRRKLLRRTRRQKGELSRHDLDEVETRAAAAYDELRLAHLFDHVIVNHDGEDSEHWDAFPIPLGEARQAVLAFAALMTGDGPRKSEHWTDGFPS